MSRRYQWIAMQPESKEEKQERRKNLNNKAATFHRKRKTATAEASKLLQVERNTDLPDTFWQQVLLQLTSDTQPEGLRSVSVVSRDIINAGML